jgi:protein-S-isoprenylcysteine O-methyltransferase Ste14
MIILAALLLAQPHFSFDSYDLDTLVDLLGIAVILAGQTLRVMTIGYEYIRRGGRAGRVYAEDLVQGGIFAHCRNPLYVGNLLIAAGFLIVLGNGWLMLLGVPLMLFIYRSIVAAEEAYLAEKFGADYAEYCRRVNRWLPDWSGLGASLAPMRFNWRRVLVKEYNTLFGVLAALLLLQVWTRANENMLSDAYWEWVAISGCTLLASYIAVRMSKKLRLLKEDSVSARLRG